MGKGGGTGTGTGTGEGGGGGREGKAEDKSFISVCPCGGFSSLLLSPPAPGLAHIKWSLAASPITAGSVASLPRRDAAGRRQRWPCPGRGKG